MIRMATITISRSTAPVSDGQGHDGRHRHQELQGGPSGRLDPLGCRPRRCRRCPGRGGGVGGGGGSRSRPGGVGGGAHAACSRPATTRSASRRAVASASRTSLDGEGRRPDPAAARSASRVSADHLGDGRPGDAAVEEGRHGHLVGRVEPGRGQVARRGRPGRPGRGRGTWPGRAARTRAADSVGPVDGPERRPPGGPGRPGRTRWGGACRAATAGRPRRRRRTRPWSGRSTAGGPRRRWRRRGCRTARGPR